MESPTILDYSPGVARDHATVVSLHAHTCHSRESLTFVPRLLACSPLGQRLMDLWATRYLKYFGRDLDFARTYWRPPLTPAAVVASEIEQADRRLGRPALVSVTDHDTIDGSARLRRLHTADRVPVSFEWTVRGPDTCFHLGIHNLPANDAATVLRECAEVTRRGDTFRLTELLAWLQEMPFVLVVLNHPFWDGKGVGRQHRAVLEQWLDRHAHFLNALEINGYRDWAENQAVVRVAAAYRLPLVAGGDRHARAPNAVLNLTRAGTFAAFASEIRASGENAIVVMPEYKEHRVARTLEAVAEVLRTDGTLAVGRRWIYRVFHDTDEHGDLPVAHYFEGREPWWLRGVVTALCVVGSPQMKAARRLAWAVGPGATP